MLRPTLFALAVLACLAGGSFASGQTASLDAILAPEGYPQHCYGNAVSDDGSAVVGMYLFNGQPSHAFRWTEAGGIQTLATLPTYPIDAEAWDVSGDGDVVIGISAASPPSGLTTTFRWDSGVLTDLHTIGGPGVFGIAATAISGNADFLVGAASTSEGSRPFRWSQGRGLEMLGRLPSFRDGGRPEAVSDDGWVVVGNATVSDAYINRAVVWSEQGVRDLGSLEGPEGFSRGYGVSAGGEFVVGTTEIPSTNSDYRAFLWTAQHGMQRLANFADASGANARSEAMAVTANGRIVVGKCRTNLSVGLRGDACIWIDGVPRQLWEYLETDHGLDLDATEWSGFTVINDVSPDGSALAGTGICEGRGAAFRVRLPPFNDEPVVEGLIADGSTAAVRIGESFSGSFSAWDLNGESMTLEASGLPQGATLTPPAGTVATGSPGAPFETTLNWTPNESHAGTEYDVSIAFRDARGKTGEVVFRLEARANDAPTIAPVAPVTIECVEGQHLVELSTTVDNPDGDPLTVTWKVNGEVVETQSVAAGEEVEYAGDYEHGENLVEVVVSDGILETTATTTVTVQDTEDPTIIVTPQVNLTTDLGEAFASTSRLTPPTAEDSSGHAVTLESDAPETLPLGERVITWTATDIGGNEVTATQRVTVVDREKPKIGSLPAIRTFCDPGKTYATLKLKKPKATDNVPGPLSVAAVVPARFKIGTTKVVWTAIDAALKFAWSARGVSFAPASSSRPLGVFPVGTTTVTLTVTDAGGAKDTDTVRVTVKLRNARKRSFGEAANESFAQAAGAVRDIAAQSETNGSLLRGLTYAEAASGLGDATGEFVRWEEGQSEDDALLAYAELRQLQQAYGDAAAQELLTAYGESGDEDALYAAIWALNGTADAAADLTER